MRPCRPVSTLARLLACVAACVSLHYATWRACDEALSRHTVALLGFIFAWRALSLCFFGILPAPVTLSDKVYGSLDTPRLNNLPRSHPTTTVNARRRVGASLVGGGEGAAFP